MDLTQFLHGVILILRISDFKNLGLKFLYIDDVIITRLSRKRHFLISQLFSNLILTLHLLTYYTRMVLVEFVDNLKNLNIFAFRICVNFRRTQRPLFFSD